MGIASLSIFRGNFVLAKVCWELISVCCSELRARCLLLGGSKSISSMLKLIVGKWPSAVQRLSAFRIVGFTIYGCVQNTNSVSLLFYETNPWLYRCNLNQKNTPSCENEALAFATTLHSFILFIVHATVANLLPCYRNPYSVIKRSKTWSWTDWKGHSHEDQSF